MATQKTISPVDGRVYVERELAGEAAVDRALERARQAFTRWREVPLVERQAVCSRFVDAFCARQEELAAELSWQMGRPVAQAPAEIRTTEKRARAMIELAGEGLADVRVPGEPGQRRWIRREPLGVVLVLAPWNYPYLTSINVVVPALLAGNTVVLKHSAQTPLCPERYAEAFAEAGLPEGSYAFLHMDHDHVARAVNDPRVAHVAFTGSVSGGRAVQQAAAGRFASVGLELGGKDPAYVRSDAPVEDTAAALVDGAFFNAGQSCCAVERIYVHREIYRSFVDAYVEEARRLRLGDPTSLETTLGPLVRPEAADAVRRQVDEAVARGARSLVDPAGFEAERPGTAYLAPRVLVGVDHDMALMHEETFGPAVGIMEVGSDGEAAELMNDSHYGLTASVWTGDPEAAEALSRRIETGTFFMNGCDDPDPMLAWVGVKDSGRGCTLSRLGYEHLSRPKSFNFKLSVGSD